MRILMMAAHLAIKNVNQIVKDVIKTFGRTGSNKNKRHIK